MKSANNRVLSDLMDNSLGLSPMGNLTVNFSGTSLSSTPRYKFVGRRLSMSTPGTPTDTSLVEISDGKCGTPRISKNVLRNGRGRGSLFRRMNSAPSGFHVDSSEDCTGNKIAMKVSTGQDCNNKKNSRAFTGSSPLKQSSLSGSPMKQDSDSRDSGFTEPPCGTVLKTATEFSKSSSQSSNENLLCRSPSTRKNDEKFTFNSVGSFDDGFLEVWDLEKSFVDENEDLPVGLSNLLKGPLLTNNIACSDEEKTVNLPRLPLRRFNSLMDTYTSPASSKAKVGSFTDDILSDDSLPCDKLPFKRPRELDTNSSKRRKPNSLYTISEKIVKETSKSRYKLQKSISESAASLSQMLHKTDLIADFTRPYALPIVSGRHEDLKSITSDTLAGLLNGEYKNKVDSYKIIDCRYPYEYEGGHIKGSINLYTKEQVEQELFASGVSNDTSLGMDESRSEKRDILIFHCEFSLERGPSLYRFLRRCDRNLSSYPSLRYPEVYLLHGGYESFYAMHKTLCDPCSYQPMVDPKHENDLRKFRIKSNSWSGDHKRQTSRSGLKRLGLF